jgi:1-deoxy-D-xylulose-5-phosphate synthase
LQRGYDQVIHDIALMDVGVAFAIDRAGIVGEDGETHQGVFDISYLRAIPNMTLFAPYNQTTMKLAMEFAKDYEHPCAFRYPRGAFIADDSEAKPYKLGESELIKDGKDALFIGYGNGVGRAIETANRLDMDLDIAILDLRFVKPLDTKMLRGLAQIYKNWYIFSDSAKMGGVGSAILEFLSQEGIKDISLTSFEYEDEFITHGNTRLVEESLEILPWQLAKRVKSDLI